MSASTTELVTHLDYSIHPESKQIILLLIPCQALNNSHRETTKATFPIVLILRDTRLKVSGQISWTQLQQLYVLKHSQPEITQVTVPNGSDTSIY